MDLMDLMDSSDTIMSSTSSLLTIITAIALGLYFGYIKKGNTAEEQRIREEKVATGFKITAAIITVIFAIIGIANGVSGTTPIIFF